MDLGRDRNKPLSGSRKNALTCRCTENLLKIQKNLKIPKKKCLHAEKNAQIFRKFAEGRKSLGRLEKFWLSTGKSYLIPGNYLAGI